MLAAVVAVAVQFPQDAGEEPVRAAIRRVPDRVPALDYPTASEASEPPVPAAE